MLLVLCGTSLVTILGAAYGQTVRRRWHTRQASSNAELQAAIVDYEQSTIDLVTDSKTQLRTHALPSNTQERWSTMPLRT